MAVLKLDRVAEALHGYQPEMPVISSSTRQAAVAAILRENDGHTEALFILRASRDGDPWSGHMAFPGGHYEPDDDNLRETAERETLEEIGVDLKHHGRYLGMINPVHANPRGRNMDMVVTPFVFALESEPVYRPNYEVAEVLWGSLDHMHSGHSFTRSDFHVAGSNQQFPGYEVGDEFVWGLTLRMLQHFFVLLDPEWEAHE